MSIVSRIRNLFGKSASPYAGSGAIGAAPFLDAFQKTPAPSPIALVHEALGTAYACGTLNSELVASTPLRLYVRTTRRAKKSRLMDRGDTRPLAKAQFDRLSRSGTVGRLIAESTEVREVLSHPVLDLIDSPNDANQDGTGISRHGLIEITQRYQEFVGRCYWYIEKGGIGETPSAIWVLSPQYVREVIGTTGDSRLIESYAFSGMGKTDYSPDEIVPFRMPDLNAGGYSGGFSPLRACFEQVKLFRMYAAQVNALLRNSGKPSSIWSPKGDGEGQSISPEEARRMRAAFRQSFAMGANGGVMVAETPGSLQMLNWPMEEILPVNSSKEIKTLIANCFAVPTTKLDRNDANLASAQTGDYAHAKDAGLPRLRRMESALNSFLLPMYGDADKQLFFAFDEPEGLRDQNTEMLQFNRAVGSGAVTRNEQRQRIGMAPVPWGDEPLLPKSFVAINQDGKPEDAPKRDGAAPVDDNRGDEEDSEPVATPSMAEDVADAVNLSEGVMALQAAYYAGRISREAAIANAVFAFRITERAAQDLFPEKAETAEPAPAVASSQGNSDTADEAMNELKRTLDPLEVRHAGGGRSTKHRRAEGNRIDGMAVIPAQAVQLKETVRRIFQRQKTSMISSASTKSMATDEEEKKRQRAALLLMLLAMLSNDETEAELMPILHGIISESAKEAFAKIGAAVPADFSGREDGLAAKLARKAARRINETTAKRLGEIFAPSEPAEEPPAGGAGADDASRIASLFDDEDRVTLIADTESVRAAAMGSLTAAAYAALKAGIDILKVWVAQPGACDQCESIALATQFGIAMDEPFAPGIEAPGDTHPDCRCSIDFLIPFNN